MSNHVLIWIECNLESQMHRLNVPNRNEGEFLGGRVSLQMNVRIETCYHTWWCGYNVWLKNRKQVKRSSTLGIYPDQDFSVRYETQTWTIGGVSMRLLTFSLSHPLSDLGYGLWVGGLSPFTTAAHPLENIGLVCTFIRRMFVVGDPLLKCMN